MSFRPLIYTKDLFKTHAWFYYFKERLDRGETINISSIQASEVLL